MRVVQNLQGVVILAERKLWRQTAAVARMILEDAAVAHWLVDHPNVASLKRRWADHLEAARFGDWLAQEELGLKVDAQASRWRSESQPGSAELAGCRHRDGAGHWTKKSVRELVTSASKRVSDREEWAERSAALRMIERRLSLPLNLALHHSPAAAQHWYTSPDAMLLEPLKAAWLAAGFHVRVALEEFAPAHLPALGDLLGAHEPRFVEPS